LLFLSESLAFGAQLQYLSEQEENRNFQIHTG